MPAQTFAADRRLLPAGIRRPAAVLTCCCAALFIVLAIRYHGDQVQGRLDGWLFSVLPGARHVRHVLTQVATAAPVAAVAVAAVAAVVMLARRRWWQAVFAALAPGLTLLVAEASKVVVDRTIDGWHALPSGHTAGVTSVALTIAVLRLHSGRTRLRRAALLGLLAATALGAAMALVMVALHDHYPTDTVAGYCAAVATTLLVAFGVDRVAGWDGAATVRGEGRL